jgi:3-hydroxyisobutyrate dehydrogenase-like beta-hydroxyacid dehydrogenase
MAERIVKAGYPVFTAVHRRPEPVDGLASMGARVLPTLEEVARASDVVITIVPADAELRETVLAPHGLAEGFSAGKTLIEMTSGTSMCLLEIERAITERGGRVLDAPVSGGTTAAAQGTLTIMIGGDPALLEECRPVLALMGTRIIRVGPAGQGKVVKMINQALAATHLLAIGEAFALGVRCGADPATLYSVIKDSSGYSKMMDLRLPGFLLSGSFQPGFKLDLMKKDVNLALESARSEGIPMLLTSAVGQLLTAASLAGYGAADFAAAARFVAGMAGVDLSEAGEAKPATA